MEVPDTPEVPMGPWRGTLVTGLPVVLVQLTVIVETFAVRVGPQLTVVVHTRVVRQAGRRRVVGAVVVWRRQSAVRRAARIAQPTVTIRR